MEETQIKDLVINGKLLAKYTMDNDILFLKVKNKIDIPAEELFTEIISHIENRGFNGIAYLNISI